MPNAQLTSNEADLQAALDLARETLYRFLAACLAEPGSTNWRLACDPASQSLAADSAEFLRAELSSQNQRLGFGEAPIADLDVASVAAELRATPEELRRQHLRAFGLIVERECPPYETEYNRGEDPFFRAQQLADVAGFYRAFGVEPTSVSRERPDHLALELEFNALLLMRIRAARELLSHDPTAAENMAVCQTARVAFFKDHLGWWAPSFARALERKAETGLYAAVGRMMSALIAADRTLLGIPPAEEPAMPLSTPDEDPEACANCALSTFSEPVSLG